MTQGLRARGGSLWYLAMTIIWGLRGGRIVLKFGVSSGSLAVLALTILAIDAGTGLRGGRTDLRGWCWWVGPLDWLSALSGPRGRACEGGPIRSRFVLFSLAEPSNVPIFTTLTACLCLIDMP